MKSFFHRPSLSSHLGQIMDDDTTSRYQRISVPLSLLVFLLCCCNLCSAASFISSNNTLHGNQTLVSSKGNFELGLFSRGNSPNLYLGICYGVSKETVVWVANRETPILVDPSSVLLKISDDGNLVIIRNGSNNNKSSSDNHPVLWSTNSTSIVTSNSTVAELRDDGNLVLRDVSNSSLIFWQSFDHPTDTWLPGGKLGLNRVTGVNQRLTSWKSTEDPSAGIYSLYIDPTGNSSQYFIDWNRSERFWTSGSWNGIIFSGVPEMTANYIYDFQYISDGKEKYFTYTVKNSSIITRFVMDLSGQIKQLSWLPGEGWFLFWTQPRAQCDVYSVCGPNSSCNQNSLQYCSCLRGFTEASLTNWTLNDRESGCVRRTKLQCEGSSNDPSNGGNQDKFLPIPNVKFPTDEQSSPTATDEPNCESACLSNCSCTAYAIEGGCLLWYGSLLNLQQLSYGASNGRIIYLRLSASELPSSKEKKWVVPGVVGGVIAGCLVLCSLIWLLCRRHRKKVKFNRLRVLEGALVSFKYKDLRRVTKNFSDKLGGGGFGSVFRGKLPDSTEIAVKKLEGISQGEKQFRTEVSTIGTIQHVNLVRLRGFCSEGAKRILVYDYMPNGSLDSVLFRNSNNNPDDDDDVPLDWKKRHSIALGVARGLVYLHEKCRDCIIHCDIKPENILLDSLLVPKVADFGLAKLVGRDFSRVLTTMRGTRGYLAPEWISGVAITAKADVYSYGMMLFEIISGRRNSADQQEMMSEEGNSGFFPAWAVRKMMEGDADVILDPRLEGDADRDEVERVCRTACWCIQDDEMSRPSMSQVVQILEGSVDVNMPPVPGSLRMILENTEHINFFSEISSAGKSSQVSTQNKSSP